MSSFAERLCEALRVKGMSAAELARRIGVNEGTISNYKKGSYIPKQRRLEDIARALNVSIPYLMGYDGVDIDSFGPVPRMNQKPRLGRIACGTPIMAEENIECYDDVPEGIDCDFTLMCQGDSMVNARILDGDIVYIKHTPKVENGQIAAVRIGDETTLKRFYKEGSTVTLMPENPKYPPRTFIGQQLDDIQIIGRAVAFTSSVR